MIKQMSNADIIYCVNGITEIQNREKNEKCNILGTKVKAFYTVIKNKQVMIDLLKPYQDALKAIMEEFEVSVDEETGNFRIEKSVIPEFNSKIADLQKIVVDVPVTTMAMEDIDGSNLTLTEFGYISFMIE
jgi:hypothetical protein